jgi:hypothetical protein
LLDIPKQLCPALTQVTVYAAPDDTGISLELILVQR